MLKNRHKAEKREFRDSLVEIGQLGRVKSEMGKLERMRSEMVKMESEKGDGERGRVRSEMKKVGREPGSSSNDLGKLGKVKS